MARPAARYKKTVALMTYVSTKKGKHIVGLDSAKVYANGF